jgi:hypothetical protein
MALAEDVTAGVVDILVVFHVQTLHSYQDLRADENSYGVQLGPREHVGAGIST